MAWWIWKSILRFFQFLELYFCPKYWHRFKGTIYYDLDAKVKGTIWARAGKTITGDIYIGDKGSTYEEKRVNKNYFYGNYDYLLDRAIANYLGS